MELDGVTDGAGWVDDSRPAALVCCGWRRSTSLSPSTVVRRRSFKGGGGHRAAMASWGVIDISEARGGCQLPFIGVYASYRELPVLGDFFPSIMHFCFSNALRLCCLIHSCISSGFGVYSPSASTCRRLLLQFGDTGVW